MSIGKSLLGLFALTMLVLTACTVHIINLKPLEDPSAELVVLEQAIVKAEAGQECDTLTLAAQARRLLLAKLELHRFQQWSYDERKSERDYSEEMKQRLEKAIRDNWRLGEEAAKLYSLSGLYKTELSSEGASLAKAVIQAADANDVAYQLALGYTIAGLEWNTDYLKKEKEDYFNNLLASVGQMAGKGSVLEKNYVGRIAAQAGNGKATTCRATPTVPSRGASVPVNVQFDGEIGVSDKEAELLREFILQTAINAPLATRPKKVTIGLKVEAMDKYKLGRYALNVLTFTAVGYVHLGGGNAVFSSFVQEEGDEPIPLAVNTFEINAKSTDALTLLVTNYIIGRAEFALLKKEVE